MNVRETPSGDWILCCFCASWWDNREHRPGGIERKPWTNDWRNKLMKNNKDFDGNKLKHCFGFPPCDQLTVGELKKQLANYPDSAKVYMEASNAYSRNDTSWAQRGLDTYPCKEDKEDKKALMIVGSIR
ncbi:MAG: hypothetical protein KAS66_04015 [Candidatus Omnitrophica bacterium]|nr:hypothetical protein [Candidatus Omnitrophota bacterium]